MIDRSKYARGRQFTGATFDGGGLFGIGQARTLERLEGMGVDRWDFFAGTSVGAVVAAYLATGGKAARLCQFFHEDGPMIFRGHWWRKLKPWTPRYDDAALVSALRDKFGSRLLGDVPVPLWVVATDFEKGKPVIYSSLDPHYADVPLWEAVRASVAAPTYFLPWGNKVDGGLVCNNPSSVAVAGMVHEGHKLKDLRLVSFGLDPDVENVQHGSTRYWTHVRWGLKVIKLSLEGASSGMHHYFTRAMLPDGDYLRVSLLIPEEWSFDDPEVVEKGERLWQNRIGENARRVHQFVRRLP